MSKILVQYIIIREDLSKTLKWTIGAVIAQACHAAVAATHLFADVSDTQEYLRDLDSMHKIVLKVNFN